MLIISETARCDLIEIWSYVAEYNIDPAHKVIKELANKFGLIEANPLLDRAQDGLIVEMRLFSHINYHIYYFPC